MNKNYKFKIRPYNIWFVWMGSFIFVFEFILGAAFGFQNLQIIILPILFACFTIYSFVWGWNSAMYFDDEKAYRKVNGKIYEWHYDDMIDIELKIHDSRIPVTICKIKSAKHEKLLTFYCSRNTIKKFVNVCTNAKIKYKLLYIAEENLNIKF